MAQNMSLGKMSNIWEDEVNDGHFFDGMVMNFVKGTIAIDGFSMDWLPLNHHHLVTLDFTLVSR